MKQPDELEKLFSGFNPELKDDFMSKLSDRLDAVEMVKEANEKRLHRERRSALYAAIAGFIAGIIMSALYSRIASAVSSIGFNHMSLTPEAVTLVTWIIIAATTVFIGFAAYDLTRTLAGAKSADR